ncbi:MAG: ATP-binding protein [Gammaproteobacteria bacterium]|nr:ATP-binding protein [Gammaproteobacteria bacterium]
MKSSTGRWVVDKDFFDRKLELEILQSRIQDRNHIVLSGQRRMGKTSLLKELPRRLTREGWLVLFVDVEGATSAEDAIADIAQAAYEHRPLRSRFVDGMKNWLNESVDELDVHNFRLKLRANLDSRSWRRLGE